MKNPPLREEFKFRGSLSALCAAYALLACPRILSAQEIGSSPGVKVDLRELAMAGGYIGMVIAALSVILIALIIEHLISIRKSALMPPDLAPQVHALLAQNQFKQAEDLCRQNPSLLGEILQAGLSEVGLEYSDIEKSMEDASVEQSSRLLRKIEYLSVIGSIAPMLGLLGTVWGMILAFLEFESKANPQVSELAPGIYKALVTTLMGLGVAVPAVAMFAIFRNRVDGLVAETSLLAEHVFADFRKSLLGLRRGKPGSGGVPPIVQEKGPR